MRRFLSLLLLVALPGLVACDHADGDAPPRADGVGAPVRPAPQGRKVKPLSAADRQVLIQAAERYVKAEVDAPVTVSLDTVIGDLARISVTPVDSLSLDPAVAFLRRGPDGWTGVTLGTAFPPEDADALGLPPEILP